MEGKTLYIEMFGGFQVFLDAEPIITKESRNSKVLQLMQYLVCNHGRMVPQDELIGVIIGSEECENPVGTLKNLVYRLRKLLESSGVSGELIQYKKGAYGFCDTISCRIDEEEFTALVGRIRSGEDSEEDTFELCLNAIDLYKGVFLPKTSGEPWVMGHSVQFQEMYSECFRKAYGIAEKTGKQDNLVSRLQKAAALYPYEEDLSLMYIYCLYETKRVKEAMEVYDSTITTLFDDLGIGPSERLQKLYQKMTGGMQEIALSVADVRSKIGENEYEKGAYFCNLEVFSNIYRFVVRHMERSGQSVFLMLCTITGLDGAPPESGDKTQKVIEYFHDSVKASLRRGDAYTRYSPSQFLLMLMEIKLENCDIVSERLRRNFYKHPKMNQMRLACKSISAADMDFMMSNHIPEEELKW